MATLTFDALDRLTGCTLGIHDVACPICGPEKRGTSARRKVLRVWHQDDGFATYKCARCGVSGYARRAGNGASSTRSAESIIKNMADRAKQQREESAEIERKQRRPRAIWEQSIPAAGTLVETYLRARGITIPIPPVLKFHQRLRHAPSHTTWPAMVALIQHGVTDKAMAVHRTYLREDGTGKADVEPNKMMLGEVAGCAVQLTPIYNEIVIAEGIETALSITQMTDKPCWAALSAGGIEALDLPLAVRRVILAADADDRGDEAVRKAGARLKAADPSRHISIARPPKGMDFNDVLIGKQDIAA